jgi:hypothetical protein
MVEHDTVARRVGVQRTSTRPLVDGEREASSRSVLLAKLDLLRGRSVLLRESLDVCRPTPYRFSSGSVVAGGLRCRLTNY